MKAPNLTVRKPIRREHTKRDLTLLQYCQLYFESRDLTVSYKELFIRRIEVFVRWHGSDLKISMLTCDLVNEWLTDLQDQTSLSPQTLDGYRRYLQAVWNFAYQQGDNDDPPLRVKKIKKPQLLVQAYSHEELDKILTACEAQKGYFSENGVRRSTFWQAVVHSAYATGLRRGDLLRVQREWIGEDGRCILVQNKTGHRICVQFSAEALALIGKMEPEDDPRALPWPFHENSLSIQFREFILPAAGITHGCFKWLRRSAGSYAEQEEPGHGSRVLGHRSPAVFHAHYNDQTISVVSPTSPPPIVRSESK